MKTYVTASEIGDYVYCKRAWWLRIQGMSETTPEMKSGSIKHVRLSTFLRIIRKLIGITVIVMMGAIILLLISFYL